MPAAGCVTSQVGEVRVYANGVLVAELAENSFFGEDAILSQTVTVSDAGECITARKLCAYYVVSTCTARRRMHMHRVQK